MQKFRMYCAFSIAAITCFGLSEKTAYSAQSETTKTDALSNETNAFVEQQKRERQDKREALLRKIAQWTQRAQTGNQLRLEHIGEPVDTAITAFNQESSKYQFDSDEMKKNPEKRAALRQQLYDAYMQLLSEINSTDTTHNPAIIESRTLIRKINRFIAKNHHTINHPDSILTDDILRGLYLVVYAHTRVPGHAFSPSNNHLDALLMGRALKNFIPFFSRDGFKQYMVDDLMTGQRPAIRRIADYNGRQWDLYAYKIETETAEKYRQRKNNPELIPAEYLNDARKIVAPFAHASYNTVDEIMAHPAATSSDPQRATEDTPNQQAYNALSTPDNGFVYTRDGDAGMNYPAHHARIYVASTFDGVTKATDTNGQQIWLPSGDRTNYYIAAVPVDHSSDATLPLTQRLAQESNERDAIKRRMAERKKQQQLDEARRAEEDRQHAIRLAERARIMSEEANATITKLAAAGISAPSTSSTQTSVQNTQNKASATTELPSPRVQKKNKIIPSAAAIASTDTSEEEDDE